MSPLQGQSDAAWRFLIPAGPDEVKEPKPWPWFAGGRCTHLSHVQGGGTSGQTVLGGAEGIPQYSLHAGSGGGGHQSLKPPHELSCSEGTQAVHEPHGGRASIPLRNSSTRLRSGGGCDRAVCVSPPESERCPRQAQSWGGPGVPELATDGWRQLADTCPSSPPLSWPSLSSPLVLFDFLTLWVKPEGPAVLLHSAIGSLSRELDPSAERCRGMCWPRGGPGGPSDGG